jgi:hypothetical protein
MLTQEYVRELFDYNPETGSLLWKKPRKKINVGDIAGTIDSYGYLRVGIDGRKYKNHQIVFLYWYGYLPMTIDHINREKLDNRITNLRPVNAAQNAMNQGRDKRNKSGFKGVSWDKGTGTWLVSIKARQKALNLGRFLDPIDAACAYNMAAEEYFGEYAYLNGPENNQAWGLI